MSINHSTNDVLKQSTDFRAAVQTSTGATPDNMRAASERAIQDNSATSTLSKLVKYIPTESVTLYVAAVAAGPALHSIWAWMTPEAIYWFFGGLTPILWLLILMTKRQANKLPRLPSLSLWLVWNLIASSIAFLVWALAVPNGPYLQGENAGVIAGFLAVFISSLLSIADPLVGRPTDENLFTVAATDN